MGQRLTLEKVIGIAEKIHINDNETPLYKYHLILEILGKLPSYNSKIPILCEEHGFKLTQERDLRKYNLCLQNDCKLLYFTYKKSDIPKDWHHTVFTKEEDLITEINRLINEK